MGEIHTCNQEGVISKINTTVEHLEGKLNKLDTYYEKKIDNLEKVYDLIYGLTTSISVMTATMTGITEDIGQIKIDVKEIKSSDVASNVLVLTEQMERNIKDIANTQIDVKLIQNKDNTDYTHYKRSIIVFIILTILGIAFTQVGLK